MTIPQTRQIINQLKHKGVSFEKGLSDAEVEKIQEKFNLIFPPDLKRLLQMQIPTSDYFINWRLGLFDTDKAAEIWHTLDIPLQDIFYNLEKYDFWIESWGPKPEVLDDAKRTAKQQYECLLKLVPVFGNRYIPSKPDEIGNPVFSLNGITDAIYYGRDLAGYFSNEFHFKLNDSFQVREKPKWIEFWSWCVERYQPTCIGKL